MSVRVKDSTIEVVSGVNTLRFRLVDGSISVEVPWQEYEFTFDAEDAPELSAAFAKFAEGAKMEAKWLSLATTPILKIYNTTIYEVRALQENAISVVGENVVTVCISYYNARSYTFYRHSPSVVYTHNPKLEYVAGERGVSVRFKCEGLDANGKVVGYLAGDKEGFYWVDKETGVESNLCIASARRKDGSNVWMTILRQTDVAFVPHKSDGAQTVFNSKPKSVGAEIDAMRKKIIGELAFPSTYVCKIARSAFEWDADGSLTTSADRAKFREVMLKTAVLAAEAVTYADQYLLPKKE